MWLSHNKTLFKKANVKTVWTLEWLFATTCCGMIFPNIPNSEESAGDYFNINTPTHSCAFSLQLEKLEKKSKKTLKFTVALVLRATFTEL